MNIKNNDIIIRNATEADCEQLAAWWNDGKVMAHAGFPKGLGTSADEIRGEIAGDSDETRRRLIIEYKGNSIGEMSYYNMGGGVAEIGIKICDDSYQEKGLGKKILSMLIRELFSKGYQKIVLDTNLNNKRAQHVYETLGFTKVRENIDSWTNQVGELQSSVDYELTPKDFVSIIEIKELTLEEAEDFWNRHMKYLVEDEIISDEEDIEYFSGSEYRDVIKTLMKRDIDKHHMVYFTKDDVEIGAAQYTMYQSEDGKCFILDFWVFPEFRGNGTGHQCFRTLESYTKANGAKYYEINSEKEDSVRFWKNLGFIENGVDEYDMPLFIKR